MTLRRRQCAPVLVALCLPLLSGCALTPRSAGPPPRAVAPAFELESHHRGKVSLASLLADGPAVVVFYRGYW